MDYLVYWSTSLFILLAFSVLSLLAEVLSSASVSLCFRVSRFPSFWLCGSVPKKFPTLFSNFCIAFSHFDFQLLQTQHFNNKIVQNVVTIFAANSAILWFINFMIFRPDFHDTVSEFDEYLRTSVHHDIDFPRIHKI